MARKGGQHLETLQDLLDDEGIELRGCAPRPDDWLGHRPDPILICPDCHNGKSRDRSFFVYIDLDMQGFMAYCHRGKCSMGGQARGRRIPGASARRFEPVAPKIYRRPEPPANTDRPPAFLEYFAKFGISGDTLEALGIYRSERWMVSVNKAGETLGDGRGATRPVIVYPYIDTQTLMNNKFKAVYSGGVKRFGQEKDAEPTLFNIDSFTTAELGIIVEGEDDVAALFECGFRQTTTLVDGAPKKPKLAEKYDPLTDRDGRYVALRGDHRIDRLKKIILAGDMDDAGRAHHEEISRRVGKGRCWVVQWPDGCKDAKETLTKRGRDAVRFAVECATPYPIEGVRLTDREAVLKLYDGIHNRRYYTGQPAIDLRLSLTDTGQVIVVNGIPGHGKTAVLNALANLYTEEQARLMIADLCLPHFHTVIYSGEIDPDRVSVDFISQHVGKPFFTTKSAIERMTRDEAGASTDWVRRHFSFIDPEHRGGMATLSWLLARIEEVVTRTGAKLVIIDPWQEIDLEMPENWRQSMSNWVKQCLFRVRELAYKLRTNIVVVAHPSKVVRDKSGKYIIPEGYEVMDSQAFMSVCHIGFTVHRPSDDLTESLIRTWKGREGLLVKKGDTHLRFDPYTTRVYPKPMAVDALDEPVKPWTEADEAYEA